MQRRRGKVLEDALLQAAWDELFESGYAALTMEAVAQRAGTSRPVIYRRWPGKQEMVRAAVRQMMFRDEAPVPDTGDLRTDVLALLEFSNRHRAPISTLLIYHLGPWFQETGMTPDDLRKSALTHRTSAWDTVLDRAVARGEIDGARLTPRVRSVAIDLFRNEILLTLKPVRRRVLESIVDEVYLPLLRGR